MCIFISLHTCSIKPFAWCSPLGDSRGTPSTPAAVAACVFNATIECSPSLCNRTLLYPSVFRKLLTEVLHRIRCRSLSVHKGSSHRRGSAVLYHQDGFCSPIFFPVHRHERVVAGYHWYPILCASLFISRAVLLTNTPTGHTVLAPCPVLHMSSAFMLLHLCWCRILWRPYLYRPCQFFHFHFFSNILGSARWIWIFLTSSGRGGRSQFLGRTYASFGCRPKPEFGLVSGPFR